MVLGKRIHVRKGLEDQVRYTVLGKRIHVSIGNKVKYCMLMKVKEEGGLAAEDGVAVIAVKGCRFQRTAVSGAGGSDCGSAMQLKTYIHFRFPQVLQAPIEGPGSTLLVAEGVTGIYRTELPRVHDRPTTYTSGFFRFYRSLQV